MSRTPLILKIALPASLAMALVVGLGVIAEVPAQKSPDDKTAGEKKTTETPPYSTVTLRGRVVWLAAALKRRYKIETDPDAVESMAALETADGGLYPIVKEFRGRGFWKDPRLRDCDVELLVRRYPGNPMIQIIRVYTLKQDKKYEFDYWCDICAIPMYELKDCECCQGPIRTRERHLPSGATEPLPEK